MAVCELYERCRFLLERMETMPASTVLLKERYCQGAPTLCARFMVFKSLGREQVPANLVPSDVIRAKGIISSR